MIISEEIPPALDGERLDRVAALMTGWSRSAVRTLLSDGLVTLNGARPTGRVPRVAEGDVVVIDVPEPVPVEAPVASDDVVVPIVYEDEHMMVIDKPAGLVVHPGAGHVSDTLVNGLLATHPGLVGVGEPARPGIVHRLDRDTSGLLMVAATQSAYETLVAALAAREITRAYEAIALGHTDSPRGVIDAPIGRSRRSRVRMAVSNDGREARTYYEQRAKYYDPVGATWFRCQLETGRTHQIRVHLAAIGTPVIGDGLYGRSDSLSVGRQQLHAARLEFTHPASGDPMSFVSALPDDMVATLRSLGETNPVAD